MIHDIIFIMYSIYIYTLYIYVPDLPSCHRSPRLHPFHFAHPSLRGRPGAPLAGGGPGHRHVAGAAPVQGHGRPWPINRWNRNEKPGKNVGNTWKNISFTMGKILKAMFYYG